MYNWLGSFYRVMSGKCSVILLFFGSNSRRALLLRPRSSTVSIASYVWGGGGQRSWFNQSHGVHVAPLVICALGGGHTHTYIRTEVILGTCLVQGGGRAVISPTYGHVRIILGLRRFLGKFYIERKKVNLGLELGYSRLSVGLLYHSSYGSPH